MSTPSEQSEIMGLAGIDSDETLQYASSASGVIVGSAERGRSKPGGASRRSKSLGKVLPRRNKARSLEQASPLPVKGASSSAAAAARRTSVEATREAQANARAAEAAMHELGLCASIEMSEQSAYVQKMRGELET
eukprot:995314-Amphidinium_carterae.1